MPDEQPAETPPANAQLRDRGNVADISAILAGESNAQSAEIDKRRESGDAELGEGPDRPEGKTNGKAPPDSVADAEALDASAGIKTPEPGADEPAGTPAAEITSFKALADAAGLDIDKLYDLTISFGDGQGQDKPVKLGAIKDAYQSGLEVDAKTTALETAKADFENDQIVRNKAIDSLISTMRLTEPQIDAQRLRVADHAQREQQKLFQVVPELAKNAELRQQRHAEIVDLVKPYGISAAEVGALADHRFYKFAMDAVNWRQLISEASAESKRVRKSGNGQKISRKQSGKGKQTSGADKLADTAKQTRMPGDQIAAISALLGE